jgi:hypothetical protein
MNASLALRKTRRGVAFSFGRRLIARADVQRNSEMQRSSNALVAAAAPRGNTHGTECTFYMQRWVWSRAIAILELKKVFHVKSGK